MNHTVHNSLVNFIWGIADDVLRDVYVRGKYRDVILPMTVLRRLDCLLEPTKATVLERHAWLNDQKIFEHGPALRKTSGFVFYNTSRFTLRQLLNAPSQIKENFEDYLNGFSPNVQEIIDKFELRNQIRRLTEANVLYALVQKFVAREINLSPEPVKSNDGTVLHPGLTNLGMGYVFEELIRRFSEENNEEAGEHFTPREIIELMASVIFLPVKDKIQGTTYLVYDPACGTGGMLTEAERALHSLAEDGHKKVRLELFGQEVNAETFAICQSDMLIKERDPGNIKFGSTLSKDGCSHLQFDFMLSNPPYGKSWSVDEAAIRDKKEGITDARFKGIGVPRSSDGQLLFLVNMLQKMKTETPLGSRIATVHNGSALFTGDAGQGESEIRRWILENDWLECIIGLPLNLFYNTGIATYIWVLSNRKSPERQGKVQLIDATSWFAKLRKNLGQKNCELRPEHIEHIVKTYLNFAESSHSHLFDNADFGYRKITVERPLRLAVQFSEERASRFQELADPSVHSLVSTLQTLFGSELLLDYNAFKAKWDGYLKSSKVKLDKKAEAALSAAFVWKDERAEPVVKKRGAGGVVEYEADADLRDTENVPLKEDVQAYFAREVLPFVPNAWIDENKRDDKDGGVGIVGYEISFTKVFYKYQPLRALADITRDILALEQETEGLLHAIAGVK
ncbi:MAG: type I restriction-modification system subunit M [Acidimicrobiales bacterium]